MQPEAWNGCAFPGPTAHLPNTNILVTTVTLANGDSFQMTDFFPRFEQYGRMYRPAALFQCACSQICS